ncbi:acyltransferase [Amylibacter sp.]|nr:acyltransferase [Amylibacter sp.]
MKHKNIYNSDYIPYLDGWRGLAIIGVLYAHFVPLGNSNWLGSFGVDLFFVLSGYLMGEVLFIKRQRLDAFFIRRFSRIFPVFFIYLLIAFTAANIINDKLYSISLIELLSTLTFMRSYLPFEPSIWSAQWSIGHIWSLNIEEHTYILLAMFAFCSKGKSHAYVLRLLGLSILMTFIFRYFYIINLIEAKSDFTLYSHVAAYAILVSVFFRLLVEWKYDFFMTKNLKSIVSIMSFVTAVLVSSPIIGKPILTPILLGISITYFDANPKFFTDILSIKLFRFFGKASFSLYVWQQIFHENIDNKFYGLCLALFIGFLSYAMIENPLRRLINRKYTTKNPI